MPSSRRAASARAVGRLPMVMGSASGGARAATAPAPAAAGCGFKLAWSVLLFTFVLLVGVKLGFEMSGGGVPQQRLSLAEQRLAVELREAREMFRQSIITEAEFAQKKREIVGLPPNELPKDGDGTGAYPVLQGATYSTDKHPLQGGSKLTSSCRARMAHHKIVFIKTHKTASSTVTNLLHRFGYKYGLKFALPKDNMFYGWPYGGDASVKAVEEIGVYQAPFDIFGSGHSVLSDHQKQIVPFAEYVTILRSPVSHFRSSFRYWMISENIAEKGPKGVTAEQYLQDPAQYEPFTGNVRLLHNSFAFDFGLTTEDVAALKGHPDKIQAFIATMEERFSTVLITDYFAESLLLLKREMCWPLDDVVYGAMKVSGNGESLERRTAETEQQDPLYHRVRDYNWLDSLLYDHFNASLWQKIEAQKASGWDDELAELRARIVAFAKECTNFKSQDEDWHRAELERPDLSDSARLCHLSYTDSKGYCKTLKREQGAPIDQIECYAQRRQLNLAVVRMANSADDALFGAVMRSAHLLNNRVAVEAVTDAADYARRRMPLQMKVLRAESAPTSLVGINGLRYERGLQERLAGPRYSMTLYVVQHPVQEFFESWEALHLSRRIGESEGTAPVSMEEFFKAASRQRVDAALRIPLRADELQPVARHGFCGQLLVNRLTCRMGLDFESTKTNEASTEWFNHMSTFIIASLMAEHMEESIVLMRQLMCWRTTDFSSVNTDLWASARLTREHEDSPLRAGIEKLLHVDMKLYQTLLKAFWHRVHMRPAFFEEVQLLKNSIAAAQQSCAGVDVHALANQAAPTSYAQKGCILQKFDGPQAAAYFEGQAHRAVDILPLGASACHDANNLRTSCADE